MQRSSLKLSAQCHTVTLGNKDPAPLERREKCSEIHLWLHGADLTHLWERVPATWCLLVWDQRRERCCFPMSPCTIHAMLVVVERERDSSARKGRGSRLEGKENLRRNDLLSLAINNTLPLVPKCQLVPLYLLEFAGITYQLYFLLHVNNCAKEWGFIFIFILVFNKTEFNYLFSNLPVKTMGHHQWLLHRECPP